MSFRDCWISSFFASHSQKSSLRPFLQCRALQPRFPKGKRQDSQKSVNIPSTSTFYHFHALQCSAPRQDSKKSVLFLLLLQLCFHHCWGASLPKRFSKVSLIRGELKSGQCHQATVDFQFNVLNPSPSIMLRPPLRCLFHWEIQTLCCLSKMLFIEAVQCLSFFVSIWELISAVKVALTWELIYAKALPTQFLLLPVNFSIFNVASGQGEYLLKEWIPQWVSDEWAVIKSWQNGKWCHMYTT